MNPRDWPSGGPTEQRADATISVARLETVPPVALPMSPRDTPFVTGDRIGSYVIERVIGRGGMGVVFAAWHEHLQERVAIKLLHASAARDVVQRERFIREARSTVRIKSERVVRVLDAGVEEQTGAPFIVMEYLDGLDLGQVLARRGPMPVSMAVDCMVQICEAVAAAHALGIIHRDLKPSNFFLENRAGGASLVKVLDFGISKVGAVEGIADCKLTEAHAVFGTPAYMSPEQVRSARDVGAHSDVWSLGVALFEMLTGDLPFVADNTAGLLVAVVTDPPRRLATHRPDMSRELEAVILACLEKNPARRLGSVQELAARLAPFASADGARVVDRLHRSTVVTGRPPKHASRALAILGVVAVLLLAGAFGVRTLRRMSRVNEALPSDGVSLTAAPVADLPGAAPVTSSVAASSAATSAAASSSGPGASSSGAPADAVPLAPDAKPAKPRQRGAHAQANPPPSASALPTAPSENLDSRY